MGNVKRQLSCLETAGFCEQLAMILKAGIYLGEGLEMMSQDNTRSEEKQMLMQIHQDLEQNGALAPALEKTGVFPEYMVHMVRLGEETGRLDEVMETLAGHYTREAEIRESVRTAIAFPALMLAMVIVIVVVLLTQVMPIFQQVFAQLGAELTGVSRVLMDLGQGLRSGAVAAGAVVIVLVGAVAFLTTGGRKFAKEIFARAPGVHKLWDSISLCRFAGGMALALRSGLNPEYALELVYQLNEDGRFRQRLDRVRQAMEQGQDMTEALVNEGILSGIYGRMAAIGRKTGTLDETMLRIAENAQETVDKTIARSLGWIEPALVVILSVLVGGILLSVMFPLLGILSGM